MADLRVDPLLSYARRVGDDVEVILEVEGDPPGGGSEASLRLLSGDTMEQAASVTVSGPGRFRLELRIPESRLEGRTWRMRLLDQARPEPRNLQTRLLVRAHVPVALLPGRVPSTRLPEPSPRRNRTTPPAPPRRGVLARVVGRLRRRALAGA